MRLQGRSSPCAVPRLPPARLTCPPDRRRSCASIESPPESRNSARPAPHNALARRNRPPLRFRQRDLAIAFCVCVTHVGKARTKALVIRARQRILSLQIDVIAKDDQRALSVLDVNAPGGVGENQSAYASSPKHARGKCDLGGRIAFIQMHPSLHHGNGNVAALADHKLSGMPNCRGTRECRDVSIGNASGFGEVVSKRSQAGAEDETDLWAQFGLRKHK